jgi:hypothetical protein
MQVAGVQEERIEHQRDGAVLRPPSARAKAGRDALNPTQKLILKDLEFGYATVVDLLPVTGLGLDGVRKNLRQLHAAGLVRIAGYERNVRIWGLKGTNKDYVKPKLTIKQIKDRWRTENRDIHNACAKRYYYQNLEAVREKSRQWRKNNPEKIAAYKLRKRGLDNQSA